MLTNNYDIKSLDNENFLNLLYKYVNKYLTNIDSFIDSLFHMENSLLNDVLIDTKFILTHVHNSFEEAYSLSDDDSLDDSLDDEPVESINEMKQIPEKQIDQLRSDLRKLIIEFPRKSDDLSKINNIKEELKRILNHLKKTSDNHQERLKQIRNIPKSLVNSFRDIINKMEDLASQV